MNGNTPLQRRIWLPFSGALPGPMHGGRNRQPGATTELAVPQELSKTSGETAEDRDVASACLGWGRVPLKPSAERSSRQTLLALSRCKPTTAAQGTMYGMDVSESRTTSGKAGQMSKAEVKASSRLGSWRILMPGSC